MDDLRLPYCEYCGKSTSQKGMIDLHHIKTRGQGGPDIRENLINLGRYPLCNCHDLAQQYKIPRAKLITIVAVREGKDQEEICKLIGLDWETEYAKLTEEPQAETLEQRAKQVTLEDVIAKIVLIDETEKEALFAKGDLLLAVKEVFQDKGFTKFMASQLGITDRYVQEIIKVARVFPQERRAMDHSWYLHKLASQTKEPDWWLDKAVENAWSTRQLREEIDKSKDTGPREIKAIKRAERLIKSITEFLAGDAVYAFEQVEQMYKIIGGFIGEDV